MKRKIRQGIFFLFVSTKAEREREEVQQNKRAERLNGCVSEAAALSPRLSVECRSHLCDGRHINPNIFHDTGCNGVQE